MKVRILGAHNLESQQARHTCFLVDGVIAIDAGSLMTSLSRNERESIRSILLTHRHFDHVRDLPSLGLATLDNGKLVSVYSLAETLEAVSSRLMDGVLYPDFTRRPSQSSPKYRFCPVTPGEVLDVEGYAVRPIEVPHSAPAVGYVVREPGGRSFAYCGDTGGGLLPFFQDPFKPDPLFVEVTFAGKMEERARNSGHLTPSMLRREIRDPMHRTLSVPRIMVVHRSPDHDQEIAEELATVASDLGLDVTLAHEDMTVDL